MGSRGGSSIGGKASATSSSPRAARTCVALCLLLVLAHCSPCQARKLLAAQAEEEGGIGIGKVMYFEGGLVLRAPPPPSFVGEEPAASVPPPPTGEVAAPVPRGFVAATSRAARLMRSVPSPGVGH